MVSCGLEGVQYERGAVNSHNNRRKHMRHSLILLSLFTLFSCQGDDDDQEDIGLVCTAEFVYGLNISLFDSVSGEPLSICDVNYSITEGEYLDESDPNDFDRCDVITSILGAGERTGVYDIEIEKAGFEPWTTEGVIVNGDECHVTTVKLEAFLVPLD